MGSISKWKVLLIDDEKDIRDVLTISLRDAGYEVVSVANGDAGLLRCAEAMFQIVITDILMPGRCIEIDLCRARYLLGFNAGGRNDLSGSLG